MKERLLAVALVLASALISGAAWAHAFLDHASPAVGSTVPTSPPMLRLWFTQALEPAFSTVSVSNASGARVDGGDAKVDPGDATLLTLPLKKLPPGTYTVKWRVVSVDTHATSGDFSFTVGR